MIGLVRLLPPASDTSSSTVIDRLPPIPSAGFSGALVRCVGDLEISEALSWYADVRKVRPGFPVGIVCAPELCVGALGSFTYPVAPLLSPGDLVNGAVPALALADLRSMSVEGQLLRELAADYPAAMLGQQELLECITAHAVRGGTLESAARKIGCSVDTLRRRLSVHQISPSRLMQWLRIRAYDLRVEMGEGPRAALSAGGWNTQKARRKCRSRLKKAEAKMKCKKTGGALRQCGAGVGFGSGASLK